jgi:polyhydroxyalkanoate synthesis regulator phasin
MTEKQTEKRAKQLMDQVLKEYYGRKDWDQRSLWEMLDDAMSDFNDDMTNQIMGSIHNELAGSLSKSIPSVVPSKPQLSDFLYNNSKQVEREVFEILKDTAYTNETAQELAKKLYDGYDAYADEALDVVDDLPKYIQDYLQNPPSHLDDFLENLDKIKTKPYKTAVADIRKAMEAMDQKALEKAMEHALYEKARYYADRIAKTEIQRAKELANGKDIMNDKNIKLVKWQLSSRHKIFDICDYHARLDVGYGAGIYPKGMYPAIPLHPFCMCKVVPYYRKVKKRRFKDPTKRLMDKLTPYQQRAIAGSWDKLDDYYSGTPMIDVFNKARPKYPIRPMKDVLNGVPYVSPRLPPKKVPPPRQKPKPIPNISKRVPPIGGKSVGNKLPDRDLDIAFGYGGKYDHHVKHIRDDAKRLIKSVPPVSKIKKVKKNAYYQQSYYHSSDGSAGLLVTTDKTRTFLHEYGHHIDFTSPKASGNGVWVQASDSKEWLKARKDDMKHLKDMPMFKDKSIFEALEYRWRGSQEVAGMSDIFDSMSLGRFRDKYRMSGHGAKYYNEKRGVNAMYNVQKQQTEVFAQLFEAWANDGLGWQEANKFYPNQVKQFLEEVERIIGK